jgi:putative redox protein
MKVSTKARLQWIDKRLFLAESGSGNTIVVGNTANAEGVKLAATPMELVLMGAGGCTAFDVVDILEKGRQAIEGCEVELQAERAETEPKVFTRIHLHFVVSGRSLDPAKVERAIQLSADKYCSATAMLAKTAEITHDFEVVETEKASV